MDSLSERQIRASFVNCSRGEARRLHLPADLDLTPWADLDFLGWVDPRAPVQSYLVLDGPSPTGIRMRRNTGGAGSRRARMCSLCTTTHSGRGVSLMVAARAGRPGRDGNSVGLDICSDLGCSLYARGLLPSPAMNPAHETLPTADKVARLRRNLDAFVARVTAAPRPQRATTTA